MNAQIKINIISLFFVHFQSIRQIYYFYDGKISKDDIKAVIRMTKTKEFDRVCNEYINA
jgi:hypothetical protein